MGIDSSSFIAALNSLSEGTYLCGDDQGHFAVTNDKTKEIGPKKVAEIIKVSFEQLQKVKNSPLNYWKSVISFKEGLEHYKDVVKENVIQREALAKAAKLHFQEKEQINWAVKAMNSDHRRLLKEKENKVLLKEKTGEKDIKKLNEEIDLLDQQVKQSHQKMKRALDFAEVFIQLTIPIDYPTEQEMTAKLKEIEVDVEKMQKLDILVFEIYSKENHLNSIKTQLIKLKEVVIKLGEKPKELNELNKKISELEKEEKSLNESITIDKTSKNEILRLIQQENGLREWLNQSKDQVNELSRRKIASFFMKTLGSTYQEKEFLRGVPFFYAMESVLEAIQTYKNPPLDLIRAGKELKFALFIKDSIIGKFQNDQKKEKEIADCIAKIGQVIQGLAKNQSFILPGGSITHALLLQISKESNGTYSFTIINTGEGVVSVKSKAVDIKYTGITLDVLSKEFIEQLVDYHHPKSKTEENLQAIDKHFASFSFVKKGVGRTHALQKGANCTFQSIFSWMKGRLGKEFAPFKTHMALEEIALAKEWGHLENPLYPTIKHFFSLNKFSISDQRVAQIFQRVMKAANFAYQKRLQKTEPVAESKEEKQFEKK